MNKTPTFRLQHKGQAVSYPQSATFVIERRERNKPYSLVAYRENISQAIAKYNSSVQRGKVSRLSAVFEGRIIPMLREGL